jgi:hypothetical protein
MSKETWRLREPSWRHGTPERRVREIDRASDGALLEALTDRALAAR